jgi:deoxyribodipyrimidine photo-lyase
MILATFPVVVEETFQPHYRDLQRPGEHEGFKAWCAGETGYPLVDAAMRCLNETGWMHNRLRMVVASFLTKDLLVDYRLGEAYFARQLLDFDLASNNGGWQWAASTGVDAQPYFRIFNPILQSKKFDPDGHFIRRWCPELSNFTKDKIHWPKDAALFEQMEAGCIIGDDYPLPIVDHAVQRDAAVQLLSTKT